MKNILLFLLAATLSANAQDINIIPKPAIVTQGPGTVKLGGPFVIGVVQLTADGVRSFQFNAEAIRVARFLADELNPATGLNWEVIEMHEGRIALVLNGKPDARLGTEGYELKTGEVTSIHANTPAGLFYGAQTFMQLLPAQIESKTVVNGMSWEIPVVHIIDYPRFAWRGLMLDVSRHFFDKQYVKDYIDRMARYKFNRFHWHLTDDNGWRVEIKSLPKLTEVGSLRVPRTGTFGSNKPPQPGEGATDGGFYTQDDIREIVKYAKDRFIEILPEIDMPGHSMAAIAAYPELSTTKDASIQVNPGSKFSTWYGGGKFSMEIDNTLNPVDENTYKFIDKVFTEIATLFPFEYIHMGGDECYKGYWERNATTRDFMKEHNIQNGEELQAYFNRRVAKIITDKKKKAIGWDEILEGGIADNATVMGWRGVKGGIEASQKKHQVVMSPYPVFYLDMAQGDLSIEPPIHNTARLKDVYAFDILVPGIDSAYVLGGQGNLWTEQVAVVPQSDYMTYPRAFAIAEGLWTPKKNKDWNSFVKRTEAQFARFDQAGVNYATSMYDPIINVTKTEQGLLQVELIPEFEGLDLHYSIDNSMPGRYHPKYNGRIVLTEDADIFRVISYRGSEPVGHLISIKAEDLAKRVKK